jgi:hypothetical protein
MTPNYEKEFFPDEPRVLLSGLEYARGILDTAIHIAETSISVRPTSRLYPRWPRTEVR